MINWIISVIFGLTFYSKPIQFVQQEQFVLYKNWKETECRVNRIVDKFFHRGLGGSYDEVSLKYLILIGPVMIGHQFTYSRRAEMGQVARPAVFVMKQKSKLFHYMDQFAKIRIVGMVRNVG